jgi:hypothetical protein
MTAAFVGPWAAVAGSSEFSSSEGGCDAECGLVGSASLVFLGAPFCELSLG